MFSHEKLTVYQRSIAFVAWILEELRAKVSARDQLDRASTSVPLNLAEGNAKFSLADRGRFFQIAHGSAVECAASLDVLVGRQFMAAATATEGKSQLEAIVNMLMGLPDRCGCRIAEGEMMYGEGKEED